MSTPSCTHARILAGVLAAAVAGGTAVAVEARHEQAGPEVVTAARLDAIRPVLDAPDLDAASLAVDAYTPVWEGAERPPVPGEADTIAAVAAGAEDFAARLEAERREAEYAASRGAIWDRLADCESGNWDRSSTPIPGSRRWDYGLTFSHGDIFEGGLNFHPRTWDQYRTSSMPGHAGNASRGQQIAVAEQVLADQGWGAWPVCSRKLGYR